MCKQHSIRCGGLRSLACFADNLFRRQHLNDFTRMVGHGYLSCDFQAFVVDMAEN